MMKINFPKGYYWLLERNLISYETFGALQPWLYLPKEHQFNLNDKWGTIDCFNRIAFAKRQDNDELACFVYNLEGEVLGVDLLQGWTNDGFTILKSFNSFWEWLKHVIDDMAEWLEYDI